MSEKSIKEHSAEKGFTHYVAENKSEYKYLLKFAIPIMSDELIDCIESALKKYDLKSASEFKTTPIQENPLDFPNIKNMPVHITEIVMGYPASLDFLRVQLGNALGVGTGQIAVYSENDPRQIETDLFLERHSDKFKEGYVAILDPAHPDYDVDATIAAKLENTYGSGYNTPFLKELERVRKEQSTHIVTNSLIPNEVIDHSTLPDKYDTFNDHLSSTEDKGLFGRVKKFAKPQAGVN